MWHRPRRRRARRACAAVMNLPIALPLESACRANPTRLPQVRTRPRPSGRGWEMRVVTNRNHNRGRIRKTRGLLNRNPKRPRAMCTIKRTERVSSARAFLRTYTETYAWRARQLASFIAATVRFARLCTPLRTSFSILTSPPPASRKSKGATSSFGRAFAHSFQLQMSALSVEAWHDDGSHRWGSTYDLTQKLARFIGRIEANCRAPAPPAAPLPGLPQANSQTNAAILVCVAARKLIPLLEPSMFLYPGSGHFMRFDTDLLPVLN
jgi:hypothetical protein